MLATTKQFRQIVKSVIKFNFVESWTDKVKSDENLRYVSFRVSYGGMTDEQKAQLLKTVSDELKLSGFSNDVKITDSTASNKGNIFCRDNSGVYIRTKAVLV